MLGGSGRGLGQRQFITLEPQADMTTAKTKRLVISWFGWDIGDYELIAEESLWHQLGCLESLVASLGLEIERRGNHIDYIIGKPGKSVSNFEFFRFQREWEKMNERLGFRMSGMLWLMTEDHGDDPQWPREYYKLGIKTRGDSIGRPHRHSFEYLHNRPGPARHSDLRSHL